MSRIASYVSYCSEIVINSGDYNADKNAAVPKVSPIYRWELQKNSTFLHRKSVQSAVIRTGEKFVNSWSWICECAFLTCTSTCSKKWGSKFTPFMAHLHWSTMFRLHAIQGVFSAIEHTTIKSLATRSSGNSACWNVQSKYTAATRWPRYKRVYDWKNGI